MATEETNIQQRCRVLASKMNARLFRNNRGLFIPIDAIRMIREAAKAFGLPGVMDLLNSGKLRKQRAGLEVPGSSDLVGWKTEIITPEMVGKKVAVFCAPEIKKDGSYASADQKRFMQNVRDAGGIAGVCRNDADLQDLLDKSFYK